MIKTPDLASAYALQSKDDVCNLYQTWADTYDRDFIEAQGYLMHRHLARAFVQAKGHGPILDVGAGTGAVGAALMAEDSTLEIDGIDLSEDMLRVARSKGHYCRLTVADITRPPGDIGPYGTILSAGTFTFGHVGPEGLPSLLDLAAPGCLFILGINAEHFERAGFAATFEALSDRITDLQCEDVRIYNDRADAAHRGDLARLVRFVLK